MSLLPLITFDLGGVIVRVSSTLQQAALRAGVPWRAPRWPAQPDKIRSLLVDWQRGSLSDQVFFEHWAEALGGRFDAQEAERVSQGWLMGEISGMLLLLEQLRGAGFALGCLSNTSNHHWQLMLGDALQYPSLRLLTHTHASHLFGQIKPDAQIFSQYEKATGALPAQIVFFDDRRENVLAARACGWNAFLIDSLSPVEAQVRRALGENGVWTATP